MLSQLIGFDYQPRTRLIFGENSLDRLGELARETLDGGHPQGSHPHARSAGRVLLVSDPGIVAAGHAARAMGLLEAAGLQVRLFDGVIENPTTREVDACVEAAREADTELIIGLGGGSSMDTAKGCNFVLTSGGRMQDYWGVGKATQPMLPLIAVPTTAGTGSECQSYALIADAVTHQKMACGDPRAAARIALLDPALTVTQPRHVTTCTGIDAVAHAVETAVTRKRNEISLPFSGEAFRLLQANLPRVVEQPDDLQARGQMLLGAAFAGTAIENSMLGAAHSAANPLTAHYDVVHGQAVGVMLPWVVRFNAAEPAAQRSYAALAVEAGLAQSGDAPGEACGALVERLEALLDIAEVPRSLAEYGVEQGMIPQLAREAAAQWTAHFNPREVGAADFEGLYRQALDGRTGA